MNKIQTVYIVDDDESIRTALKRLMDSVGIRAETFASAKEFMSSYHNIETPCCLILDLQLPGTNGLELQHELMLAECTIPIIFISGHGNIPTSVKAMRNGAMDFLTKPFNDDDLLAAVRIALDKDLRIKSVARDKESIRKRFRKLSPREYEVMTYVISGMLNKQIAVSLGISEKTVKVHRARIHKKVGVVSLAELVRLTEKAGIGPVRGKE